MKGKNYVGTIKGKKYRTNSIVEGIFRITERSRGDFVKGRFLFSDGDPSIYDEYNKIIYTPVRVTRVIRW